MEDDFNDFSGLSAGKTSIGLRRCFAQVAAERDQLRAELAAAKERERVMCKPPSHCPVTGRPFFMILEGEDGEEVATYGGPFDSYTIPEWSAADAEFRSERYDHDAGYWIEGGEPYSFILVDESEQNGFIADLDAATAKAKAAESRAASLEEDLCLSRAKILAIHADLEKQQAHAARLRKALEFAITVSERVRAGTAHELPFSPDEFLSQLRAALAETPEQSVKLVQAEALRAAWQKVCAVAVATEDKKSRTFSWSDAAVIIHDEMERLEKEA